MSSQWDNFLRNLGEWRGSFASLNSDGQIIEETPSILTLQQGDEERLVHFRLRRFADGDLNGEPSRDMQEDYRNLGRQVVFFETGTFCKGRLQVSPGTAFGGEFGFIHGDRRHRLVQLHSEEGTLEQLVLIREYRAGSEAQECPALGSSDLQGRWVGSASTISADWPEPDRTEVTFEIDGSQPGQLSISGNHPSAEGAGAGGADPRALQLTWMADGGYHLTPRQVSHRAAFATEAGWMVGPGQLERLIRRYDASGAWVSATQIIASRG